MFPSPPLQLKRSSNWRCTLSSLELRLSVLPPLHLHLWLPVRSFRALNEAVCFLSCSLKKKKREKCSGGRMSLTLKEHGGTVEIIRI